MTKKLSVVNGTTSKDNSPEKAVTGLERVGGNLDKFLEQITEPGLKERFLFHVEQQLNEPGNEPWRKRWEEALRLSAKIRMDLLRSKAFGLLENYKNQAVNSSASDITFSKTVLIGVLVEDSERVRSRYRPAGTPPAPNNPEDDEYSDLEKDFNDADGV